MENRLVELSPSSKFIWRIENFSKLDVKDHYSVFFSVGGCKWRVVIYPKGNNVNHLSMYLCSEDLAKLPYAEFSFAVVNQINGKDTAKYGTQHQFIPLKPSWGFPSILPLNELNNPIKGLLVNDTCIVKVEISVCSMVENSSTNDSQKTADSSDQTEVEQEPVKVVTPIAEKEPIKASEPMPDNKQTKLLDGKGNEPMAVVDAALTTQSGEIAPLPEYPGAGQMFEEGRHHRQDIVVVDDKFEDIGGFSVLKTQASLYKQIWLKYGHIASNQVMSASSYISQVWVVTDIMNSIMDMHRCSFVEVSSEMIDLWENKIKMAEKLEFNIRWLRERFENFKKGFNGMQKFKTTLLEHGQPLRAAKVQMIVAEDELKKAQARLIKTKDELRDNIAALLSESEMEMYLEKGDSLLFDGMF